MSETIDIPTLISRMGTPDPLLLAQVKQANHDYKHATMAEIEAHKMTGDFEKLLEQILAQVINIPHAPRLKVHLEPSASGSGVDLNTYQDVLPTGEKDELMFGPRKMLIGLRDITVIIARYASQYRQSFADQILADISQGINADRSQTKIRVHSYHSLPLGHPVELLNNKATVGQRFINDYSPRILAGDPLADWVQPSGPNSHFSLKMSLPASTAASLVGQPITALVDIPATAQISRGTRDAYNRVILGEVMSHSDKGINFALEPTRQILLPSATTQRTYPRGSASKQAMINLMHTAEMI